MKKNLVSGKEPKSFTDSRFPKSKSVHASFSQPDYHTGGKARSDENQALNLTHN